MGNVDTLGGASCFGKDSTVPGRYGWHVRGRWQNHTPPSLSGDMICAYDGVDSQTMRIVRGAVNTVNTVNSDIIS